MRVYDGYRITVSGVVVSRDSKFRLTALNDNHGERLYIMIHTSNDQKGKTNICIIRVSNAVKLIIAQIYPKKTFLFINLLTKIMRRDNINIFTNKSQYRVNT